VGVFTRRRRRAQGRDRGPGLSTVVAAGVLAGHLPSAVSGGSLCGCGCLYTPLHLALMLDAAAVLDDVEGVAS
jgi:hypothetical protein